MSGALQGEACPYCRAGFEPDDEVMRCPVCGTPHHADCFAENGGCTIFGCAAAPAEEAKISVAPTDFQEGQPMYPLPAMGQVAPPPPPPPMPGGSSIPPPPRPPSFGQGYGLTGAPGGPYGYGYGGYSAPKDRVTFVLLAIFLGGFGGHNFYAGYNKRATVQLCLTIFTCMAASPVIWIWAIVEACVVTRDSDGVLLN